MSQITLDVHGAVEYLAIELATTEASAAWETDVKTFMKGVSISSAGRRSPREAAKLGSRRKFPKVRQF